jgi:biopolymer transport protein ExbD
MVVSTVIAKINKVEIFLLSLVAVLALFSTLQGAATFNNNEINVALGAVQPSTKEPVHLVSVDKNHTYYVADGENVWKVQLAKADGEWVAQTVEKSGEVVKK